MSIRPVEYQLRTPGSDDRKKRYKQYSMAKILVVEDDVEIATSVSEWLNLEKHTVDVVYNAEDGRDRLKHYQYDLIILDVNLPDGDGMELCNAYRNQGGRGFVLMLTGNDRIIDKEKGLDSGADDYLTKPFHPRELSARLRALMRRSNRGPAPSSKIEINDVVIHPQSRMVFKAGEPVNLMPREFALLEFLMRNRGQVFSHDAILDRVWSSESEVSTETVRVHIRNIRSKLGCEGNSLIRTVHRQGYCIDE